ncbi:MAG TPA: VOC family protein [Ferrovibrio sp.]|uniref:VOC family protein n=1 Tax=Ferrovibrio sp. TaxID=1917215 RepID=UPI002ED18A43
MIATGKDGQAMQAIAPHSITPCLWFDGRGEEAARFYVSIFPNSKIETMSRYGKEGFEIHGQPEGAVMTVSFTLNGQAFTALNGGPLFRFNEAVSFQVPCDTQQEIDYFWERLGEGGEEGPCGWLKDKFGLSWQVFPRALPDMLSDPDAPKVARVTKAFLRMKKFDLARLRDAFEGRG